MSMSVCLFMVLCPSREFSLTWRRHHYRWRAANFAIYSALMAIERWGFFSVPHLLWHGTSVYNGHLRWYMKLIPVAEPYRMRMSWIKFSWPQSVGKETSVLRCSLYGKGSKALHDIEARHMNTNYATLKRKCT